MRNQTDRGLRKPRVLVLSFDFPPGRTSAVYRIKALAKYLFRLGWDVTVLTTQIHPGNEVDPTLLENFPPDIRIARTPYVSFSSWEAPTLPVLRSLGVLSSKPNPPTGQSHLDQFLRKIASLFRACFYFPDDTVGWVPFAFIEAMHLHMQRPFDAVYSTSPPRSAGLVALALQRVFGLPWVMEYMDPWYPSQRPWRKRFERRLEAAELRCADAVIAVTENHAQKLREDFSLPENCVTVIRNGYDEEDFQRISPVPVPPEGLLHLTHVGTIYPGFGGCFFTALEDLVREYPELAQRVRVNIIGYPDYAAERHSRNELFREVVQIHGYMRHMETLQAMQASHVLLLFLGDPDFSQLVISSKIYEYLRVGRPILAVAYPGGVQELIEAGRAGWAVRPDDPVQMKNVLLELLNVESNTSVARPASPEAGFVASFRYDFLAGQLAEVLNRVIHGRRE